HSRLEVMNDLPTIDFGSDNRAPVAPEILRAIAAEAEGTAPAYGGDESTARLERLFEGLFERPVWAFPVATGTAANALAISHLCPAWGAVFCHTNAHVHVDECGAPEFFGGGTKLLPLGTGPKITAADLVEALATHSPSVHQIQPTVLTLAQSSEWGGTYSVTEIQSLTRVAREAGLRTHMDGARFANALAFLNASPAEVTWKAGIDVLSFGATKNGGLMAEAVVFFDEDLAQGFAYRRKRAGQLLSKMRYVSVQLEASVAEGRWLSYAKRANAMASRLHAGLSQIEGVSLPYPCEANIVFADLPEGMADSLRAKGFVFFGWGSGRVRLVTSYATLPTEVDALVEAVRALSTR
ncbi:MAG: threonine aldolase, partial [Myxococcales bacterium]|nr:threonine aldolase [Myxococcales bacterium]